LSQARFASDLTEQDDRLFPSGHFGRPNSPPRLPTEIEGGRLFLWLVGSSQSRSGSSGFAFCLEGGPPREGGDPSTALEELTDEEWDWTFDTGVKATLRAMQAVFPYMKEHGGGRIVNFASRRGIMCNPDSAAYNCSKEAVRALSRTAANAWGQYGITVNVLNPVIETDAARGVFDQSPGIRERVEQQIPLRRWGQPVDCARVAVFLAGPDSAYLSGMTFMVDGGLTALP
jgi:NAD(P)-dependent dehydrogenase (short-subunit alcohol dehydrogenase family)